MPLGAPASSSSVPVSRPTAADLSLACRLAAASSSCCPLPYCGPAAASLLPVTCLQTRSGRACWTIPTYLNSTRSLPVFICQNAPASNSCPSAGLMAGSEVEAAPCHMTSLTADHFQPSRRIIADSLGECLGAAATSIHDLPFPPQYLESSLRAEAVRADCCLHGNWVHL